MPRIAIILGRLVIGGSTMDTLQVARYLQNEYEILLITGGSGKDELEATYLTEHLPGIRHERIEGFSGNISPLHDLIAYRRIRKALKRFRPDIVHTHSAKAGLLGRMAAFSAKVPVTVHTYHGMLFQGYYSRHISNIVIILERWLGKKTTCIVALSQIQQHQLINQYKIAHAGKIRIIPLGIEINDFIDHQAQKRIAFRNQYLLNPEEIAVGIIGRIVPIKNHLFFLQVMQLLLQKNLTVRFFIIGDGVLRKQLQQESDRLEIKHAFFPENPVWAPLTYTSWITEIDKAVNGLDIIALTSINEGTPVSLIEAQAAGRPIVALKAGGIDDILIHGKTGYTVKQGDVEAFAGYLEKLIVNPALRKEMGEAGALLAVRQFQKQRQVEQLKGLYQHLITGNL